jgi:D-glycero-D-manno-heptose 1,7-bisphosphate phosphatase
VKEAGFPVIVITTNQPDIPTGKQSAGILDAMHARLTEELGIDDVLVCPHVDNDHCDCRKPKSALILAAAKKWDVDCARSIMAGDRWRDVGAGRTAGCAAVFIDHGYAEKRPEGAFLVIPPPPPPRVYKVPSVQNITKGPV